MKFSRYEKNVSLKNHSWLKVGGEAELFASPKSVDEVLSILQDIHDNKWNYSIISGGSNVLIADGLIGGLTISLHEMTGIEHIDVPQSTEGKNNEVTIVCLAGTAKSEIAKIFLQNRLAPAVFLTGIPGDMGGGVVMNAGIGEARTPREFCEIIKEIEVARWNSEKRAAELVRINGKDMQWEYRHSSGWQPGIITRVKVGWDFSPDVNVPNDVRTQTRKRISTQPLDLPNCGSVFRNPLGHKSAQLIESCGLKGFRIGGASVSKKHANFIVNDQGATASDIERIIEHVQKAVFEKHKVHLVTEVVFIGPSSKGC